jgi:hypothetical protein
MSWIVEAPNNNPSVFGLISSTVFQIDGSGARLVGEDCMLGLPTARLLSVQSAARSMQRITSNSSRMGLCRVRIWSEIRHSAGSTLVAAACGQEPAWQVRQLPTRNQKRYGSARRMGVAIVAELFALLGTGLGVLLESLRNRFSESARHRQARADRCESLIRTCVMNRSAIFRLDELYGRESRGEHVLKEDQDEAGSRYARARQV